jgi:hypothetical protein
MIRELPKEVRTGLKIHTAETLRDVLKIALERPIPRTTRRPVKPQADRERQGYFEYIESHVAH